MIDENLYHEYWENMLANLLAQEITESEPKLWEYGEDEIHIKLKLSESVLEFLMEETIQILNLF